jgi:hypothetical protein
VLLRVLLVLLLAAILVLGLVCAAFVEPWPLSSSA